MSHDPDHPEAPPPLLGTWGNLYALVLGALIVQIVAYTWLSWVLS